MVIEQIKMRVNKSKYIKNVSTIYRFAFIEILFFKAWTNAQQASG